MTSTLRRLFDADLRRFARNVSFLQFAIVAMLPMNIVQSIVLARTLGPAGLGKVAALVALVRLVNQVCEAGAANLIVMFGPRYSTAGDPRFAALLKASTLLTLASGVASALLSALALAVLYHVGWCDGPMALAGSWFAIASIVGGLEVLVPPILRITGRFGTDAKIRIFLTVVSLCTISGTALVTHRPLTVIIAYGVADVALGTIGWLCVTRLLVRDRALHIARASLPVLRPDWPEMRHYAILTWISSSSLMAFFRADEFIASFVAPPYAIGLYKIAKNGAYALTAMCDAVLETAYVEIATLWVAGAGGRLRKLVNALTAGGAGLSVVLMLIVWLFGRQAIHLLYGDSFADAFPLLQIQMLGVLSVAGVWMYPLLRAAGRIRVLVIFEVAASAGSIAAMLLLGSRWGVTGVTAGRVLFTVFLSLSAAAYIARNRSALFTMPVQPQVDPMAALMVERT